MKWKQIIFGACISLVFLIKSSAYADNSVNDEYIVYLKSLPQRMQSVQSDINKSYIVVSKRELLELLSKDKVEFYEPNCEVRLFEDFSGSNNSEQWNLDIINVSKAWDIGCYGNDIKVGVIDSGVYNHTDLADNLLEGHNYLTDRSDVTDNIGHGTFVSGIIAAEANGEYIDGIANHAKIVPLKCFDNGFKTTASMIADAIYDAVDIYGCDVINMSFGMDEALTNKTLSLSVKYALQNGCIVVVSVGNDGSSKEYYPAKYDGVIGVGAINENKSLAYFSQKNNTVDVVAPGSGIESLYIKGYDKNSGTSFSAPHVAAMAAIAKCVDKDITPLEFEEILQKTSVDLGDTGYDTSFGYGLIDIEAMINKLLENTDYFISPITETGERVMVKIYNNTTDKLSAIGIATSYENNIFKSMIAYPIELLPKGIAEISNDKLNCVKFMLWNDMKTLCPLAQYRKYTKN